MSTEQKQTVDFALKNVELYLVELHPPLEALPGDAIFDFNIEGGYQFNEKEHQVIAHTVISIRAKDHEAILGKVATAVIFEINNWQEVVEIEDNNVNIPEAFLTVLHSISYSTTRGIMYMQFRGTFLQNAHLPVIDPKNLINPNKQS